MAEEITVLAEWVELFRGFGNWQPVIAAVAIFLFFVLARGIFTGLLFSIILGFSHKTKTELDNNILLAFREPLKSLILLIGIYFALLVLPLADRFYLILKPIYRTLLVCFVAQGFYNLADSKNF
ncbi:MAG TPA: mechanosensitive ion channel family protein, partial [Firmicutes bacterium]|nr:mechanosensitive ion channel family protein [Bacillota bacterium]